MDPFAARSRDEPISNELAEEKIGDLEEPSCFVCAHEVLAQAFAVRTKNVAGSRGLCERLWSGLSLVWRGLALTMAISSPSGSLPCRREAHACRQRGRLSRRPRERSTAR